MTHTPHEPYCTRPSKVFFHITLSSNQYSIFWDEFYILFILHKLEKTSSMWSYIEIFSRFRFIIGHENSALYVLITIYFKVTAEVQILRIISLKKGSVY